METWPLTFFNEAKWNLGKVIIKPMLPFLHYQVGGGGDPGRSAGALPCAFAGVCSASLLACFYLTMARNTQQSETPMKVCPWKLNFGNVGFWGEGKTRVPGEKPLGAGTRTNKLNPHMTPSLGIEPGPSLVGGLHGRQMHNHCAISAPHPCI